MLPTLIVISSDILRFASIVNTIILIVLLVISELAFGENQKEIQRKLLPYILLFLALTAFTIYKQVTKN